MAATLMTGATIVGTMVPLAYQGSKCVYGWATKLPN